MADSDKALTILPNGELGLCEHYSEDHFVGHIDGDQLDSSVLQSFREEWPSIGDCNTCFFYPECIRLKACAEQRECFPEMREEERQKMLEAMLTTYDAWLTKESTDEEDVPGIC